MPYWGKREHGVPVNSAYPPVSPPAEKGGSLPTSAQLLRATATVGSCTFLSRVSGFLRDMCTARFFGASPAYDAFLVAFKAANFLRRLFAEGAFSQAFTPILCEYQSQRSHQDVRLLIAGTTGTLATVICVLTLLVWLYAPQILAILAPGLHGDRALWATEMLCITFPYLLCIACCALWAAVLTSYRVYAPPAIAPILLNVALIVATLTPVTVGREAVYRLAWGVLAGGILQCAWVGYHVWRAGHWQRPHWDWGNPGVQRIAHQMLPGVLGASVAQIGLLVDTVFVSYLQAGSFSWLYYADRLMEFPLAIVGVALATVALPDLSRSIANGDQRTYYATLAWALQWNIVVAVPAALSLFIFAEPMVHAVFAYGAFTATDVRQTARALEVFAWAVGPIMFSKIACSAFYAKQDMRTPLYTAMVAVCINIAVCVYGVWFQGGDHTVLCAAIALSATFQVLALSIRWAYQEPGFLHGRAISYTAFKSAIAALSMVAFWEWTLPIALAGGLLAPSVWLRWGTLTVMLVFGGLLYGAVLWALGFHGRREVLPCV